MNNKVSIITPCHNGEDYIARYLDSILHQTYNDIELIIINDGSNDKTESVIKSYISKFESKKMELKYIYQEKSGQAAALNVGLKIFSGEYLTWPDSDDLLSNDSIEKKVEFLKKNKNYGLVRSDAAIVNEQNLNRIVGYLARNNSNKFKDDLFVDYILEDKVWFAPGCFMLKTSCFLEVNPAKNIYPGFGGQNWQMLLPLMYSFKCGYIDEPLYTYVVRSDSHSHKKLNLAESIKRCYEHEDILVNTLNSILMSENEKQSFITLIKKKYIKKRFNLAVKYNNKLIAEQEFNNLKNYEITFKDTFSNFIVKTKITSFVGNILIKLPGKVKRLLG